MATASDNTSPHSGLATLEKRAIRYLDEFIDGKWTETCRQVPVISLQGHVGLVKDMREYIGSNPKKVEDFIVARTHLWRVSVSTCTTRTKLAQMMVVEKQPEIIRSAFVRILEYVQRKSEDVKYGGTNLSNVSVLIGQHIPVLKRELGTGLDGVKVFLLSFPSLFIPLPFDPEKQQLASMKFKNRAVVVDGVILLQPMKTSELKADAATNAESTSTKRDTKEPSSSSKESASTKRDTKEPSSSSKESASTKRDTKEPSSSSKESASTKRDTKEPSSSSKESASTKRDTKQSSASVEQPTSTSTAPSASGQLRLTGCGLVQRFISKFGFIQDDLTGESAYFRVEAFQGEEDALRQLIAAKRRFCFDAFISPKYETDKTVNKWYVIRMWCASKPDSTAATAGACGGSKETTLEEELNSELDQTRVTQPPSAKSKSEGATALKAGLQQRQDQSEQGEKSSIVTGIRPELVKDFHLMTSVGNAAVAKNSASARPPVAAARQARPKVIQKWDVSCQTDFNDERELLLRLLRQSPDLLKLVRAMRGENR